MPIIENKDIKVGSIMAFPVSQIPDGWLICNGAEISRSIYKNLFDIIGTTYGTGDGVTTFNIPDLRGKFIRGYGAHDSNRVSEQLGVVQQDALLNHRHKQYAYGASDGGGPGRSGNGYSYDAWTTWNSDDGFRYANENRPINLAMVFCIKY